MVAEQNRQRQADEERLRRSVVADRQRGRELAAIEEVQDAKAQVRRALDITIDYLSKTNQPQLARFLARFDEVIHAGAIAHIEPEDLRVLSAKAREVLEQEETAQRQLREARGITARAK